jgi:hypothetical protein
MGGVVAGEAQRSEVTWRAKKLVLIGDFAWPRDKILPYIYNIEWYGTAKSSVPQALPEASSGPSPSQRVPYQHRRALYRRASYAWTYPTGVRRSLPRVFATQL